MLVTAVHLLPRCSVLPQSSSLPTCYEVEVAAGRQKTKKHWGQDGNSYENEGWCTVCFPKQDVGTPWRLEAGLKQASIRATMTQAMLLPCIRGLGREGQPPQQAHVFKHMALRNGL